MVNTEMKTSYERPSIMVIKLSHCQMLCDSTVIGPGENNEPPVREEHHFGDKNVWDDEW